MQNNEATLQLNENIKKNQESNTGATGTNLISSEQGSVPENNNPQQDEKAPLGLGVLKASKSRGTKPFHLMFENLVYEIQIGKGQTKKIINNESGYLTSGQITAIMGPSGCGKTSLLNFLTNRIQFAKSSVHSGKIYLNSEEIGSEGVAEYSSYVMQDDVMMDCLTPTELLMFISKLRSEKSEEEHKQEVDEMIDILKIAKCKDTKIGNAQRKGLSGGERKRVSIGCEIISNPSILFLDEPTSGLDSTTSEVVISFLKELAQIKNMIVAFTIHQPSSMIFNLFDKLIIVNKGEMVYQGPVKDSSGKGIVSYFDNEINIPLEAKANPADAFMHVLEEQNAHFEGTHQLENEHLKDKPALTELYKQKKLPQIESEIKGILDAGEKCTLPKKESHKVPFGKEFGQMMWRSWTAYIRNPFTLSIKFIMTAVYAFIALSIFWRMDNSYQGTYNKAGFIFFFGVNNFLSIVFSAIMVFPEERVIFLRDYANKLYGIITYYLTKNIVETPIILVNTFIFGCIIYHGVGLRDDEVVYFFRFLCIFLVLAWMSHSLGYFLGTSFEDLNTATIICQFTVIPFFLFSGFLINVHNMPIWLSWLQYFSPFRFCVEAGLKNEFVDNEKSNFNASEEYGMDLGMWNCVICMLCWGIFYRVMGGVMLKLMIKKTG